MTKEDFRISINDDNELVIHLENGVLNILLPKKEQVVIEPKVRQIEVQ